MTNFTANFTTNFFEKNIKSIAITAAFGLMIGLAFTIYQYRQTSQEAKLQEQFFTIEIKIKKMKEEQFKTTQEAKQDVKGAAKPATVSVPELQAELEAFVTTAQKTVAGQMAALELAQILMTENKPDLAAEWLTKTETASSNLTNLLVRMKKGQALSLANKCADAIAVWDKVVADSNAQYLHIEAKVNQALCYKNMNDLAKAEDVLLQIKNNTKNGEYSAEKNPDVEKVLRLIQFQKNAGI